MYCVAAAWRLIKHPACHCRTKSCKMNALLAEAARHGNDRLNTHYDVRFGKRGQIRNLDRKGGGRWATATLACHIRCALYQILRNWSHARRKMHMRKMHRLRKMHMRKMHRLRKMHVSLKMHVRKMHLLRKI